MSKIKFMKLKSAIIFSLIFMVIYAIVMIVTAPFLISWGERPSIFKKAINFFTSVPVDWNYLMWRKSVAFVFLNGLFWGIVIYILVFILRKLSMLPFKK